MGHSFPFQKLCQKDTRKLVMVMGILATVVIFFWPFMLLYGNAFSSLYPAFKAAVFAKGSFTTEGSSPESTRVNNLSYSSNLTDSTDPSTVLNTGFKLVHDNTTGERDMVDDFELDEARDDHFELDEDRKTGKEFSDGEVVDDSDKSAAEQVIHPDSPLENTRKHELSPHEPEKPDDKFASDTVRRSDSPSIVTNITSPDSNHESPPAMLPTFPTVEYGVPGWMDVSATSPAMLPTLLENGVLGKSDVSASPPAMLPTIPAVESGVPGRLDVSASPPTMLPTLPAVEIGVPGRLDVASSESPVILSNVSVTSKEAAFMLESQEKLGLLQKGSATSSNSSTVSTSRTVKRGRQQITISQMSNILLQNRASPSMKPHWSSTSDKELLTLKRQVESAPIVRNDQELDGVVFRNISKFKMSYALMERRLKVYIYKEGERPIFHQPFLKGTYASEGWFMKTLEGNRKFVVNQPRKAHLFYLPFCSLILRMLLYKPELHTWKNLREFLTDYIDEIAAKYPFWNRTDGADHFFVACHDWAPKITRGRMEQSIGALCNADVSREFKLGKDVSLPVTNVRSEQNPLRDLGGKPASQRTTLAFYAGHVHGRLREILLQYWENKDPDMKIMGPIPMGVGNRKMTYIQHMKNSKYCICPRGYEVDSPRVAEAFFYECVPVIISDNYVPPFFEILDWETFAVFVAQKDIPKLKDILLSIPEERYLIMQERVKKVQQHFLWHKKAVKYDIFHMILHSIWFNRLNQVRVK